MPVAQQRGDLSDPKGCVGEQASSRFHAPTLDVSVWGLTQERAEDRVEAITAPPQPASQDLNVKTRIELVVANHLDCLTKPSVQPYQIQSDSTVGWP